jgi:hypothetical protein
VIEYQTVCDRFAQLCGSPGSPVASVRSALSLNGSDEMTVAAAKWSLGGGSAAAV